MFGTGVPRGPAAELMAVLADAAGESLAATARVDVSGLQASELQALACDLESARRSLDATVGHVLVALQQVKATETTSALATSKWLAREAALPQGVAAARLRTAERLRGLLPVVEDAFTAGVIGFDQARVFADAVNERNAEAFALVVPDLIDAASRTAFGRWKADVIAVAEALDADGGHDPAGDVLRSKAYWADSDRFSMLRAEFIGDRAAVARQIIEERTDELYRRYSREKELFPDEKIPCRSTLRAFAIVELLREGHAAKNTAAPQVEASVIIHPDAVSTDPGSPTEGTLAGDAVAPDGLVVTTPDGHRVSGGVASVLVCAALFHTLVMTVSETGNPYAETDSYRPNRALRRAIERRDGGCTFPGCTATLSWCDAHHIRPWPHGPTAKWNLILACRRHHRYLHKGGWAVRLDDDGWTHWTSPAGTTRTGQRHGRTRAGP